MIREAIQKSAEGMELSLPDIQGTVHDMIEGRATQAQIGAFLMLLRQRGETPNEVAGFARVLREAGVRISPKVNGRLIDTCGTGGDRIKTFNVSTLSALVAAGAGASVAKHGNRSVTSKCGSADVLEYLGVNLSATPDTVRRSIEEQGIGFLFAPSFHPAMGQVAGARKELGVRTVFNLVGPLINPAGTKSQVVGVYSPDLVSKVAEVLRLLGSEEAIVVHGLEGMDEISITGRTLASWLREGKVSQREFSPRDFGMIPRKAMFDEVKDVKDGARLALKVLKGKAAGSDLSDMVVANSAAALTVAGLAEGFKEGAGLAMKSLTSGAALERLRGLVEASGGDTPKLEGLLAEN